MMMGQIVTLTDDEIGDIVTSFAPKVITARITVDSAPPKVVKVRIVKEAGIDDYPSVRAVVVREKTPLQKREFMRARS